MTKSFSPLLFAHLLKTDEQRTLGRFAFSIGHTFVESFKQGKTDVQTATTLFVILFGHSPDVIGPLCEHAIGTKKLSTQFKLTLIGLGFKGGNKVLGRIPRYLLSVFKNGGMHLASQMLLTRPAVGIALLSKGAAKVAFFLALKDVECQGLSLVHPVSGHHNRAEQQETRKDVRIVSVKAVSEGCGAVVK
jgi:hypothetical protein